MYYGSPNRQQQERIPIPGRLILQDEQVRGWNVPQSNACEYPGALGVALFNRHPHIDRNFGFECLEQFGIRPQAAAQQAAVDDESSCHRDGGGHSHNRDGLSDGRGDGGVELGSGQYTGRGLAQLPRFVLTENGTSRVHPRYSATSACWSDPRGP